MNTFRSRADTLFVADYSIHIILFFSVKTVLKKIISNICHRQFLPLNEAVDSTAICHRILAGWVETGNALELAK